MRIISNKSEYGYRRPVKVNDWGNLGYYMEAVQSDSGTWGLRDQDPKKELKAGMRVHVLWPNATITMETIVGEKVMSTITEQGDPMGGYPVTTQALFIEGRYNGVKVKMALESLAIKLPA